MKNDALRTLALLCAKKTAGKNTKCSRNERILKNGHLAKIGYSLGEMRSLGQK